MPNLNLSVAVGDYDRNRPLIAGAVRIDGVDPVFMTLSPEEIFFRAFRSVDFDICELSLSSYTVKTALGECPYVGIPAFVSKAFRHNSIYVRTDRIKEPGRPEKIAVKLPEGVRLDNAPDGATISSLLDKGEIDGFIAPRPPSFIERGHPDVGWLFPDPVAAAKDWYQRTKIFPIMHLIGVRRTLADRHPWVPVAVFKAFEQSKTAALAALSDTAATKVTLPFVEETLKSVRELMGHDFWSYGVEPNRKTLEMFLRHHHSQGLSPRLMKVEEMFHPSVYEMFKL